MEIIGIQKLGMTLKEYQAKQREGQRYRSLKTIDPATYAGLALAGEAGEVANDVKKIHRDEDGILTPERALKIALELGDCLWYISALAGEIGLTLEEVALLNISKLEELRFQDTLKNKKG